MTTRTQSTFKAFFAWKGCQIEESGVWAEASDSGRSRRRLCERLVGDTSAALSSDCQCHSVSGAQLLLHDICSAHSLSNAVHAPCYHLKYAAHYKRSVSQSRTYCAVGSAVRSTVTLRVYRLFLLNSFCRGTRLYCCLSVLSL